jgi:hypothetical protein
VYVANGCDDCQFSFVVCLCVPKTYATWADVLYLAVGSGAASGTWAAGRAAPTPVEDATILGLWA